MTSDLDTCLFNAIFSITFSSNSPIVNVSLGVFVGSVFLEDILKTNRQKYDI